MDIGIVINIEGAADAPSYRDARALAQAAERAGLDSVWIYDHLLFDGDAGLKGQWEAFMFLAALAGATTTARLGTLVACAAFRNPALLAKQATALDEISQGRFTLGLGAGWNELEFRAFGYPFDHRVSRFADDLQIIAPLLRTGRVDFTGQYAQAPECVDLPRRAGHAVPILIGSGQPRMLELAARHADGINTGLDFATAPEKQDRVAAACQAAGRDPATLARTITLWAALPHLGDTPPHMAGSAYAAPADLAATLRRCQALAPAAVMVDFRPNTLAGLAFVAEAARLARAAPDA